MITPRNVIRHELIGLAAEVVRASNPAQTGIRGRIVDETKRTLVFLTERGLRRIPKRFTVFRLELPDGTMVEVQGSALEMSPEKRVTIRGS